MQSTFASGAGERKCPQLLVVADTSEKWNQINFAPRGGQVEDSCFLPIQLETMRREKKKRGALPPLSGLRRELLIRSRKAGSVFAGRLPSSAEKTAHEPPELGTGATSIVSVARLPSCRQPANRRMTEIRNIITRSHEPYILTSSIGEDIPAGRRKVGPRPCPTAGPGPHCPGLL